MVLGIKCWHWQNHRISWVGAQGPSSPAPVMSLCPCGTMPHQQENAPSPNSASPPGQDAKILPTNSAQSRGSLVLQLPMMPKPSLKWESLRRGSNFLCHFQFSFPQLNTVPLTSFAVEGAAFQQCMKQAALLTGSSTAWLIYDQLFPYYGSIQALPARAGSPNVVTNAEQ